MSEAQSTPKLPGILCLTDKCDRPESELFIGLKKKGFPLAVLANPDGANYERLHRAGLIAGPMALRNRFDKEGTAAIRKELETGRYDVVHAFNPRALACALRASRGVSVKIVAYRGVIGNISYLNPESWITFLHPRVDLIVSVADAIRDYLASLRFLWMRLRPSKLVTVYKGHDLSWYRDTPADLREFDIPADAFTVCCTGRDVPRKGFDVLIDALARLPPDVVIHLLLVGDLDRNEAVRQQVQTLSHPERVHFTGFRRDAPALAAASDVFVLPSKEREGLPRAVIEAMSYGVAPIVTDVGGMPELVESGVSGLVVPPADSQALSAALLELYHDRGRLKQMGQNARRRIETNFHTSQTVEQMGMIYCKLMGQN
ncbi:glycosyltransferase family 4 protein [Marinobacter metalliresistant]|uniref:Glycosyltransferase family 4 protein n=1 Tax=Marinobacter metalliresistant TaxID=2961995 RepID=A0ABZ2W0H0_9GAMM